MARRLEADILGSSRDATSAPHGWIVLKLSQSCVSVERDRELSNWNLTPVVVRPFGLVPRPRPHPRAARRAARTARKCS